MTVELQGLSSMATKELLAVLSAAVRRRSSLEVHFESAGGIEVVRKIRNGADADLAVLGAEQMAALGADGLLDLGTLRPLFDSDVVAAVPDGAEVVPPSTEDELRAALLAARRIAYSSGPSGGALVDLLRRWQLADAVHHKLVRAPPGTPVGILLAVGDADLGFQQRSELAGVAGVRVLGPLPGGAAIRSTFSGAVLARSKKAEPAREVLRFMSSTDAEEHITDAGMMVASA